MSEFPLFRRLRFGKPIVIVSGLPRSGTSMMMQMLDAGGMPILADHQRAADDDNPRGYYELERVKELDKGGDKSWLAKEARGKAIKIISFLLRDLPPNNNYKIIFMRRHIDEIVASQNKMLDRRGESANAANDAQARALLSKHLNTLDFQMKRRAHLRVLDLPYAEMIDHPRALCERVREFIGKALNTEKMAGVADAGLYRNRAK